jgi:predicted nuclease with TOPRIM domain
MSDPAMVKLYLDSVEEMKELRKALDPLEEREQELQAKFAPIRQELKAVCKEITKIKRENNYGVLWSRIMKLKPKFDRGEL